MKTTVVLQSTCPKCGYADLHNEQICPQCDTNIGPSDLPPPLPVDKPGLILTMWALGCLVSLAYATDIVIAAAIFDAVSLIIALVLATGKNPTNRNNGRARIAVELICWGILFLMIHTRRQ